MDFVRLLVTALAFGGNSAGRILQAVSRKLGEWTSDYGLYFDPGTVLHPYHLNETYPGPYAYTDNNVTVVAQCEPGVAACQCLVDDQLCRVKQIETFEEATTCADFQTEYKTPHTQLWMVIVAGIVGAVMAYGIGANDAANSWAPSVGSGAIAAWKAMLIGAIMEWCGALLLGQNISGTIRQGLSGLDDVECWACGYCNSKMTLYAAAMLATLIGAVFFTLLATFTAMPVSTTHAVISAAAGATVVCVGWNCLNWSFTELGLSTILVSWVLSPALSGVIGCVTFFFLDRVVMRARNPVKRAFVVMPMFAALSTYVTTFLSLSTATQAQLMMVALMALAAALLVGIITVLFVLPWLRKQVAAGNLAPSLQVEGGGDEWRGDDEQPHDVELAANVKKAPVYKKDAIIEEDEDEWSARDEEDLIAGYHTDSEDDFRTVSLKAAGRAPLGAEYQEAVRTVIERGWWQRNFKQEQGIGESMHPGVHRAAGLGSSVAHPAERTAGDKETIGDILKDKLDDMDDRLESILKDQLDEGFIPDEIRQYKEAVVATMTPEQRDAMWIFSVLLVFQAALQSFAHGANDTANATGPFIAVWNTYKYGLTDCHQNNQNIVAFAIAGFFVALGLCTFGYRVIVTIGLKMTDVNFITGFSVGFATTVSVVLATIIGLPVSSTHAVVGGVVVVGMIANGWKSVGWRLVGTISLSWVITIPISACIGALVTWILTFAVRA